MSPENRRTRASARTSLLAALLLFVTLVFAGCGGNDESSGSSDDAGPAAVAPADAAVYAEVLLQPDGEVEEGVVSAIRRVSLLDDPVGELRRALDEEVDDDSISFSRDIEPWLGERAGIFVIPASNDPEFEDPDVGIAVAVRDEGAAENALDKISSDGETRRGSYEGVDYSVDEHDDTVAALVDGHFVVGTMAGFRAAVDASRGETLGESERYEEAVGGVADDALAFAYVDPQPLLPALRASAATATTGDPSVATLLDQVRDAEPVTMSFTARADELALEISGDDTAMPESDGAGGEVSIDDLPGDAWAAIATPPLGPLVRQALEQSGQYDMLAQQLRTAGGLDLERDLLGWLGGFAAFVRGTAPLELGGGIVIGSNDEAASRRFVTRLEQILGAVGMPVRPASGGTGFEVTIPSSPQPVVVIAQGDKVAIGFGGPSARDALDPDESFADSETGKAVLDTLGEGYEPSFALVFGPMLQLVRAVGADSDPEFQEALPYLSAYRSVAAGSKRADGRVTVRIVAGLQKPTE